MDNTEIEVDKVLGANLSRLRTMAGYTQSGLGAALARPIRSQQVSKYELGENQLTAMRIWEFSLVLNCPVTEFFRGIGDIDNPVPKSTRAEVELMVDYQGLTMPVQDAVRHIIHTLAKELRHAN